MNKYILVNKNITYFLLLVFFSFSRGTFSQTKSELEEKRKKSMQEIAGANEVLNQIRKNKQSTVSKLVVLNKSIKLREKLLENLTKEVELLEKKLNEKNIEINGLNKELQNIKNEYAKIIYHSYLRRNYDNHFVFIFSSHDFNQAYKRLKYLSQYADYRKKQGIKIVELGTIISNEANMLEKIIEEKKQLADQKEREKIRMEFEKKEENKLIDELKKKEKEILKEIQKNKQIAKNLEKEIQKLIAAEAKKSIENQKMKLTPEEKLLADNFSKNKGKLPWPLRQGVVISDFGRHQHPVLKGIYIENSGIDISTIQHAKVRVIFDGVVSKIFAIKGANYTVIVRHGSFLSIYQNLINVKVSVGQPVSTKQEIADVYYNENDFSAILHIEIWNELNKMNPIEWLARNTK